MRREKSLRIGVHHANGVVWGPVKGERTPPFFLASVNAAFASSAAS